MPNGVEAYESTYDEAYDGEAYDGESRFRPRRVTTARPTPLPPRPAERPVTQAQLQMAVNKLNGDISRNSTAIQRVNTGVTALGRDVRRQTTGVRDARKDIGQLRDALILLPLLTTGLGDTNPALAAIFPMLMVSGIGESGAAREGGGMFGGGDQMTMMMLVLALSGGLGGRS